MKKLVLMALFATSLFGCASEQYFVAQGAEALAYKEHHNFEFEIKNRAKTAQQLDALIQEIESTDKEATYVVDYKSAASKQMLKEIFVGDYGSGSRTLDKHCCSVCDVED